MEWGSGCPFWDVTTMVPNVCLELGIWGALEQLSLEVMDPGCPPFASCLLTSAFCFLPFRRLLLPTFAFCFLPFCCLFAAFSPPNAGLADCGGNDSADDYYAALPDF